jgi:hypothetical protein
MQKADKFLPLSRKNYRHDDQILMVQDEGVASTVIFVFLPLKCVPSHFFLIPFFIALVYRQVAWGLCQPRIVCLARLVLGSRALEEIETASPAIWLCRDGLVLKNKHIFINAENVFKGG